MKGTEEHIKESLVPYTGKGIWKVEKVSNTEISISNNYERCYAYINEDKTKLVVDRKIYPKYIEVMALKFAAKNIESIYK